MVEIFEMHNSHVTPVKELLLISPFKELWERDNSKHKETAIREFSYICFLVSPRKTNPYAGYHPDVKKEKIIEGVWKQAWEPDELVNEGVTLYEEWLMNASPSMRYYNAVKSGIEETINFFENVDFNERNDKGIPVYKIGEVIAALKSSNEVLKSMSDLKERVEQELYESSKTKSNKEINPFER
jgi:hypothetical protein